MFPSSGLWIEKEMPYSANQSGEREAMWTIKKKAGTILKDVWWQKGIMSPSPSAGLFLTFRCHPLQGFKTKYSWLFNKPPNRSSVKFWISLDILKAVYVGQK